MEKKEKNYERHDVKDTCFSLIHETTKNTWQIAVGNELVSKTIFMKRETAEKYIQKKPWELILNCVAIFAKFMKNEIQYDIENKLELQKKTIKIKK